MKKIFAKHQAKLFPVLDISLNGASFIFYVYIAWNLVPSDYGVLNALLSLYSLMLVIGISFQIYTAKYIAECMLLKNNQLSIRIGEIRKTAYLIIGAVSVLYLILLIPFHTITRGGYIALLQLFVNFIINIFLSINRGITQGLKQFFQLNISFYIEVTVKLIFVLIFLNFFKSINMVFISIMVGALVSFLHSKIVTKKLLKNQKERTKKEKRKSHLLKLLTISTANFFTYFLTAIDIIVVNYFIPEISGYFAVVLKYSQLLLYASVSVNTVFIPSLSGLKYDIHLFRKKMRQLLLIISGMILLVILVFYFIASPTVDIFFGKQYGRAKDYILLDCIPYALLILNFTTINLHIIFDNRKYLSVLFTGSVLLLGLLIVFHNSLSQMIFIESIIYAVMLILQLILLSKEMKYAG